MSFQAPFEIAQSQLRRLKFSSVEAREVEGALFPFFDAEGVTRFLAIDTLTGQHQGGQGQGGQRGIWVVDEFPLEIRLRKAIYPRPILSYRPLLELEPEALAGLYYFDHRSALASQPSLAEAAASALAAGNVALRARGHESMRDLFFTLDLRRLTGGLSRSGFFQKQRLELAALQAFLHEAEPTRA